MLRVVYVTSVVVIYDVLYLGSKLMIHCVVKGLYHVCNQERLSLLYTGGLFHCYMLGQIHMSFWGVGSILSLLFYF